MFQNIGTTEFVVVGLVLLVFFGGKKLPELARGIGDSISEFKKAAK
jgi:sec-independent protein translocase protein TatA